MKVEALAGPGLAPLVAFGAGTVHARLLASLVGPVRPCGRDVSVARTAGAREESWSVCNQRLFA